MLKALADRLAEAFAEHLHARVRREFWGYAAGETLSNEELIAEEIPRHPPGPGYPACPDHTEKGDLFALLDAPARAGMHSPKLRHDSGGLGERLLPRPPGQRTTSRSARSAATSSKTGPRAAGMSVAEAEKLAGALALERRTGAATR
jgi:hypothetical protein